MASKLVTQEQSAAILGKQGQDEYLWSWPAEYRLHTIPTGSKAARARTYRKSHCSVPSNCALLLVHLNAARATHSLERHCKDDTPHIHASERVPRLRLSLVTISPSGCDCKMTKKDLNAGGVTYLVTHDSSAVS